MTFLKNLALELIKYASVLSIFGRGAVNRES